MLVRPFQVAKEEVRISGDKPLLLVVIVAVTFFVVVVVGGGGGGGGGGVGGGGGGCHLVGGWLVIAGGLDEMSLLFVDGCSF